MIVVASAHSTGATVTSLALALSSARPTLLAECDLTFGSIRSGLRQGTPGGEIGLGRLGLAMRQGQLREAFNHSLQHLGRPGDDQRLWLPGLTDPLQAADLEQVWEPLSGLLRDREQQGWDVIVDAGRMAFRAGRLDVAHCCAPLIYLADVVLVVVRNTHTSVAQTRPALWALQDDLAAHGREDSVRLLVIEEGELASRDVSWAMGRTGPPVIASLPVEERVAALLTHGGRGGNSLRKSRLLERARAAAHAVRVEVNTAAVRRPQAPHAPSAVPMPPGARRG